MEIMAGRGTENKGVYLDASHLGAGFVEKKFPGMVERVKDIGKDLAREKVEVTPTAHYQMGGVKIDTHCQCNLKGLLVCGEDAGGTHGANRLGASALMQGLADGYFILPYTIGNYFASEGKPPEVATDHPEARKVVEEVRHRVDRLLAANGKRTPDMFHRELGELVWEECGMSRNEAGLKRALQRIPELPRDVHDLDGLLRVAESLFESAGRGGGPEASEPGGTGAAGAGSGGALDPSTGSSSEPSADSSTGTSSGISTGISTEEDELDPATSERAAR